MWLVWIDAFSKYESVERVKNANGFNTVKECSKLFSMFGNPDQIVSDNGTPFTSRKFGEFCNINGIRHIRSAPYHPSTNGEAERFVQNFKRSFTPYIGSDIDVDLELLQFLQRYRTIPHSTTGRTPLELLLGRTLRITLDLLRPPQVNRTVQRNQLRSIENHDRTVKQREFVVGQPVFVRQYTGPRKWSGGVVLRKAGPLSYEVQVGDQVQSRHVSQLLLNQSEHRDVSDEQKQLQFDISEPEPQVPVV